MNCAHRVPAGTFSGRAHRCLNRAKYGAYCGTHSPERQVARRKARGPTVTERRWVEQYARAAALSRVLACARELAKITPAAGPLNVALKRYDALKGER